MQKRVEVHAEYKVTLRIFLYSAQPVCLILIKQIFSLISHKYSRLFKGIPSQRSFSRTE